jgi:hypothetical protein
MATTTESRTARSLPQPSDLLLVQRGSTPYRATADEVKAFMLSPATAVVIGAIRPGTNLSVDVDGTLHAAIPGSLTYRGAIDPTTTAAPAGAAVGDVYLASAGGAALASWQGLAGEQIAQGDLLLFDGSNWTSRTSAADNTWASLCWSPQRELLVAVASSGSSRIMTSADGITWTVRSTPATTSWRSICWSPQRSQFAAVSNSGTGNRVMVSP